MSFLTREFRIGCFNITGLLEDNFVQDLSWILSYLHGSVLQCLGAWELWSSLKGGSAGYGFLYLDTRVVQEHWKA